MAKGDLQENFLLNVAQSLIPVSLQDFRQSGMRVNLDVQVSVAKGKAGKFGQQYANGAFPGAGHAYQADGFWKFDFGFSFYGCFDNRLRNLSLTNLLYRFTLRTLTF